MKAIPNDIFFSQVESELAAGRSVIIKVKGNSMYPFLRNGIDSVKIEPVNQQLGNNDVVIFYYNGRHILHRIIKIEGEKYTMQGDSILITTETCTRKDIIGIVTHIRRGNGKMIPVTSLRWRALSSIWQSLRFARRYLLGVIRRLSTFAIH